MNDDVWADFTENAPIGLQSVGPDGKILWANRAHLDLLGYRQEDVIGSHLSRFHGDRELCETFLARLAAGETLRDFAAPLVTRDGVRHVLIHANVCRKGTRFAHSRCIIRDVTDRKRLEDELAAQARALAEADRQKDEFLATLSHELRTPLNAILGWARLLRDGRVDASKHASALATIERNATVQARLIDELLDLARIVSGKLALDVRPLDLAELVTATVESLRPAAQGKSIALTYSLDRLAGPCLGDKSRLAQVLWNLVTNAIKFTPLRGRVHVKLERENGGAQVVVSDTGAGIEPDLLPHVFERFRQGESNLTRAHGGLGLGLTIARRLVALHGGTIEAASEGPARGATFTVRLPLLHASPLALASESSPPVVATPLVLENVRVLVVDDDEDTRDLVSEILTMCGATVATAATAEAALDILRRSPPHALLTDIGMPDLDGVSLLQQARHEGLDVPACALSARARTEDHERALRAGFSGYLAKPVDPTALCELVARLVRRAVA